MHIFHFEDNKIDQAFKACLKPIYYIIFFGFIVSFLTLATSMYSLEVFDRVLSSGSIETLVSLTIIMIVFSIILNFIQGIRSSILHHISDFLDHKLSSLLIGLSFSSIIQDNSKPAISGNIQDLTTIKNFISSPSLISVIDAPWSLIYIIVIFFIHPLLGYLVVIGALILLLLAWINDFLTKKELLKANQMNLHSAGELEIMSRNAEVVESMSMKEILISNWQEINEKLIKIKNHISFKSNFVGNSTKFFRSAIYVLTVAFGAVLVLNHKMSPGGIIACSILSSKALMPFDSAISLWNSLIGTKKSYERLKKLVTDNDKSMESISLPVPTGKLSIEKMAFTILKLQKVVIKGINIEINPGEIIAIIGPTAAGKSTLGKLITGIYNPTVGHVRVDNADIRNWKSGELGQYIGYLPQDIELFNGDIKTNIARMNKKADDKTVIAAAKMACVHDMILKLPKGYETDIGPWGTKISSGQRQRIALARAFYGNPKLIVLDEPNSNLDQEGEIALAKAIENAREKNITVLVISHRTSIVKVVDKILVMYDGEAKLFGPKSEILAKMNMADTGVNIDNI